MNIKCPNCGGPVMFDVESGNMKCDYCGKLCSKDEFSRYNDAASSTSTNESTDTNKPTLTLKLNTDNQTSGAEHQSFRLKDSPVTAPAVSPIDNSEPLSRKTPTFSPATSCTPKAAPASEFMDMKIYHCSSCGADLMVGETQASTFCSYCGSPSIVYERVSKEQKPSKIIPFKLSKQQALACIKDRFGHGSYIPPKIKELTPDKVRAIYIPFWLYNAYIRKSVLITARDNDGDRHIYNRDVSCTYQNICMDGSLRLSNDMAHRLEPYYMNELEDFDIAYLSGFYADKFDVPYDAFEGQVHKRCQQFITSEILRSCPSANRISTKSGDIANYTKSDEQEEYQLQDVSYALFPAYFVNLQYGNSKQLIIVNGQTGKAVGNLPFEKDQFVRMFIKNAAIACTIFSLLSILFLTVSPLKMLFIFPVLITAIFLVTGISSYKKYKLGMQQLASQQMTSYVNRREE